MSGTYASRPALNNAVAMPGKPGVPSVGNLPHYRGNGYIAGTSPNGLVTAGGTPAAKTVELRHFATRIVIAVITSNADGTYLFDGLDPAVAFEVIGRDGSSTYAPVIVGPVYPKAH